MKKLKMNRKECKAQFLGENNFFVLDKSKSLETNLVKSFGDNVTDWGADCLVSFTDSQRLDYKGLKWSNIEALVSSKDFS